MPTETPTQPLETEELKLQRGAQQASRRPQGCQVEGRYVAAEVEHQKVRHTRGQAVGLQSELCVADDRAARRTENGEVGVAVVTPRARGLDAVCVDEQPHG